MKKQIMRNVMLATLVITAVFLSSCADRVGSFNPERVHNITVRRLDRQLDLTPDQREVLEEVSADILEILDSNPRLSEEDMQTIIDSFVGETPDRAVVAAVLDENRSDLEARRALVYTEYLRFHAVLSPDQREELLRLILSRN